ncbi:hypothetical protein IEQ34_013720 [Dendrobium chrysotoxum]|uniref:Glycosyl transferase 48 domain-containing protein n=1 Tax=Dendrobium chrysotoxum TaxID=161865 RepID=A0AAV7GT28_DENCH|nr:hypothetical protein IEQ34_013720 [Dendrobium chrysotoxum]
MEEKWEFHPQNMEEILRDRDNRYTGGGRSCWGSGDPKDKLIDKEKNVNEEGKEINLQNQADGADQEIYHIKLPGAIKIGEGEPKNQNHAFVFTRGEALQAIDMN